MAPFFASKLRDTELPEFMREWNLLTSTFLSLVMHRVYHLLLHYKNNTESGNIKRCHFIYDYSRRCSVFKMPGWLNCTISLSRYTQVAEKSLPQLPSLWVSKEKVVVYTYVHSHKWCGGTCSAPYPITKHNTTSCPWRGSLLSVGEKNAGTWLVRSREQRGLFTCREPSGSRTLNILKSRVVLFPVGKCYRARLCAGHRTVKGAESVQGRKGCPSLLLLSGMVHKRDITPERSFRRGWASCRSKQYDVDLYR